MGGSPTPNAPLHLELSSISQVSPRTDGLVRTTSSKMNGLITSLADLCNPKSVFGVEIYAMSGEGAAKDVGVVYSQLGELIASLAGFGITTASLFKFAASNTQDSLKSTATKVKLVFAALKILLTFPIRKSNQTDAGYGLKVTTWVLAALNTGQNAIISSPKTSGGIMIAANLIILVMALVADGMDKEDGWSWSTDSLSNLGGAVGGAALVSKNGDAEVIGWGGSYFSIVIGFVGAIYKLADGKDNEALQIINIGGF